MSTSNFDLITLMLYLTIGLVTVLLVSMAEKNTKLQIIGDDQAKTYTLLGKVIYSLLFLILVFFACFRYVDVGIGGSDALVYIDWFKDGIRPGFDLISVITLKQQEPLFFAMTFIIRSITDNYLIYFFVIYSIIIGAYLKFFSRNFESRMMMLPIILFIINYIYSFSAIRSSMALAIGLLAIDAYRRNKKMHALLLGIIAFLFHYSSIIIIVFFLFYEVYNRKIFKRKLSLTFALIVTTIIMVVFLDQASTILESTKYRAYLSNPNNLRGQLPTIFFAIITLLNHKSLIMKMGNKKIYIYCVYFSALLIPAVINLGAYRLHSYFDFPKLVVISFLIVVFGEKFSKKNKWDRFLIKYSLGVSIVAWTIYMIIRTSLPAGLMPYINILFM